MLSCNPFLKPRARGKALKDKKKRTAQAAFQRAKLADAFVENRPLMIAARKIAMELSEGKASNEQVVNKVDKIIVEHSEHKPLSAAQKQTVIQFVKRQIQKHQNSDKVERLIIDADDRIFISCGVKLNDIALWVILLLGLQLELQRKPTVRRLLSLQS